MALRHEPSLLDDWTVERLKEKMSLRTEATLNKIFLGHEEKLRNMAAVLGAYLIEQPCLVATGQLETIPQKPQMYSDAQSELANTLSNLPKGRAYCTIVESGKPVEYTIETLKPLASPTSDKQPTSTPIPNSDLLQRLLNSHRLNTPKDKNWIPPTEPLGPWDVEHQVPSEEPTIEGESEEEVASDSNFSKEQSRLRYGRPRAEIEGEIQGRLSTGYTQAKKAPSKNSSQQEKRTRIVGEQPLPTQQTDSGIYDDDGPITTDE
jgi:hypothetical protein